MRTVSFLLLGVFFQACAFEASEEEEAEVPLEPELMMCPYPGGCDNSTVIDCAKLGNRNCYECGNRDGVLCCFQGPCTIVNKPQVLAPIGN